MGRLLSRTHSNGCVPADDKESVVPQTDTRSAEVLLLFRPFVLHHGFLRRRFGLVATLLRHVPTPLLAPRAPRNSSRSAYTPDKSPLLVGWACMVSMVLSHTRGLVTGRRQLRSEEKLSYANKYGRRA